MPQYNGNRISVGVQDTDLIVQDIVRLHKASPEPLNDLGAVVLKQGPLVMGNGRYALPSRWNKSNMYSFFNLNFNDDLNEANQSVIRAIHIAAVSSGERYLLGGSIESQFIFTPTDKKRIGNNFSYEAGEYHAVSAFRDVPAKLANDDETLKDAAKERMVQYAVGFNMTLDGVLEGQTIGKRMLKSLLEWTLERKGVLEGNLKQLPDDEEQSRELVLKDILHLAKLLECAVNHIYTTQRATSQGMEDVQIGYCASSGILPHLYKEEGEKKPLVAQSYSITDTDGTPVYQFFVDGRGDRKLESPKSERGLPSGTITVPRPERQAPPRFGIPGTEKRKRDSARDPSGPIVQPITLDDVIGAEKAKAELRQVCEFFRNPEKYRKFLISQKRGVILYGPPGTGKTLLARAVANEADATFINCDATDIEDKFSGEAERKLKTILDHARSYERSILFFDEFDSIARKRELSDASPHGTEQRLVTKILTFLDGFKRITGVYLIGATNRLETIDSAIRQRLYEVEVGLPDCNAREEMIRRKIKDHRKKAEVHPFSESLDYHAVAEASNGLSGRELVDDAKGIFNELLILAMNHSTDQQIYAITTKDWLDAIHTLKAKKNPRGDDPVEDDPANSRYL